MLREILQETKVAVLDKDRELVRQKAQENIEQIQRENHGNFNKSRKVETK